MPPPLPPQLAPEQLTLLAQDDLGPKVLGIVISFTILAVVTVLLRFFTRVRFTQLVGWEDYFVALSVIFSIATAVCQIKQVKYGSGKHQPLVDLPSTITSLRYLYCSILTYCVGFTLTKISILTQYRRIFTAKAARVRIYVVMGICVATGIAAFFTFAFACTPVDASWNVVKKANAKCIEEYAARYVHGSLNTSTDLLIAALPVRGIWRLRLVRRQRIALIAILTLGWFVCIVSILRVHSLNILARNPLDAMFYSAQPAYWASIEMNLAIVCACVPTLKPLVVRAFPAFSSRKSGNESSERSETSKGSKPGGLHSFQRLNGSSGDVEKGLDATELQTVTALPAIYRQKTTDSKGHIRVTHDLAQKSSPWRSGSPAPL